MTIERHPSKSQSRFMFVRFIYINHYVCLDSIKKFYFENPFDPKRASRK